MKLSLHLQPLNPVPARRGGVKVEKRAKLSLTSLYSGMELVLFFYLIVFLFGLTAGSFLNCVIYRLEKEESFLKGRSFCTQCRHQLTWRDLIPILSFFILKGKCRYCHQKISWQYPLVEIVTGLLFVSISNRFASIVKENSFFSAFGNGSSVFNFLNLIYYWTIASFLIIIFVYDLKHYIIPDRVIYPAIGITFFYNIYQLTINNQRLAINNFSSAILAATFFLAIVVVSRGRWMGVGDIKLAFLMGLILGFPNILVALFLAFFLGAIIGLGLIISGRKTLKSEIPFGPFLITGTFIGLFCGGEIINWYLKLFV
jgi:prepilin signal peptidase PulO-like enzyme (type II secretory pathway)